MSPLATNGNGNGGPDSWTEWRQHVLITLKDVNEKVDTLIVEVAMLKVKAGIWGLVGGSIPVIIGLALAYLKQ